MLEPQAVAIVARNASAEQVAHLRQILNRGSKTLAPEVFVDTDREFNRAVISYCGNPVLSSLLDSFSSPTHRARVWRAVTDRKASERTRREHAAIVDAIEAHQPDVAAVRALVHVAGVEDWLRRARPGHSAESDGGQSDP